jgi:hypothetical protein
MSGEIVRKLLRKRSMSMERACILLKLVFWIGWLEEGGK